MLSLICLPAALSGAPALATGARIRPTSHRRILPDDAGMAPMVSCIAKLVSSTRGGRGDDCCRFSNSLTAKPSHSAGCSQAIRGWLARG